MRLSLFAFLCTLVKAQVTGDSPESSLDATLNNTLRPVSDVSQPSLNGTESNVTIDLNSIEVAPIVTFCMLDFTMSYAPDDDQNLVPDPPPGFMSFDEWKRRMSFEEWRQRQKEGKEEDTAEVVEEDRVPSNHTRFNFASFDCAATIAEHNAEARSSTSILSEKKDRYMLNPCSASQFVTIELCDEIRIDSVVLANYEFFSGIFKRFKVSVGEPDQWKDAGSLRAKNVRGVQTFSLTPPPGFYKFLRIDILEHYGKEYFCPLSLVRVHGATQMDVFRSEEGRKERKNVTEVVEIPVPEVKVKAKEEEKEDGESIYRTISKRLSNLETNTSLSLRYIEEQSAMMKDTLVTMEGQMQKALQQLAEHEKEQNLFSSQMRARMQELDAELTAKLKRAAGELTWQKILSLLQFLLIFGGAVVYAHQHGLLKQTLQAGNSRKRRLIEVAANSTRLIKRRPLMRMTPEPLSFMHIVGPTWPERPPRVRTASGQLPPQTPQAHIHQVDYAASIVDSS